jgi:dimethylaniline monooxygenase (N-oxide forming)
MHSVIEGYLLPVSALGWLVVGRNWRNYWSAYDVIRLFTAAFVPHTWFLPSTVQSSPEQYEFPGKKYPEHIRSRKDPPCPSAAEVCEYLTEYCHEKGISDTFEFGVTVKNVARKVNGEWTVTTSNGTETFAFVVICTGLFSTKPNILNVPGIDEFKKTGGHVEHTSTWLSPEQFEGKNVLVIGNGKSAADAAICASKVAKAAGTTPPIQAIRKQNWFIPRFMFNFKWAFHSRIVAAVLPRYFESESLAAKILHPLAYPIKWILWRILELIFLVLLGLPVALWPRMGTLDEASLSTTVVVTDERHLKPIRSGEIDMRVCQVQKLSPGHAHLSTGDTVPIDMVVMGTGWQLDYSFLDEKSVLSKLDFVEDGLWLYRNILPPQLDGIAFVGSNVHAFMHTYTSFVQAFWLADLLAGHRASESEKVMYDSIAREKAFKRRHFPFCSMRGAGIGPYMQHYHDLLFAEQGIDPLIYSGPFALVHHMFMPILPETMGKSFEKAMLALKKDD